MDKNIWVVEILIFEVNSLKLSYFIIIGYCEIYLMYLEFVC